MNEFYVKGDYVGFDIDGCINDIERFMLEHMFDFCARYEKFEVVDDTSYYVSDFMGIDREISDNFWREYSNIMLKEIPARNHVKDAIKVIKESGKKIWIVTARSSRDLPNGSREDVADITVKWLKENGIDFDKISFDVENKGEFCKKNGISLMVEDSMTNILSLMQNGIQVFCFEARWNKSLSERELPNLFKRIYSWKHFIIRYKRECKII